MTGPSGTAEGAYADGSPFRPARKAPVLHRALPVTGDTDGIELVIARAKTPLLERLGDTGLGKRRFHPTVRAAVEATR